MKKKQLSEKDKHGMSDNDELDSEHHGWQRRLTHLSNNTTPLHDP